MKRFAALVLLLTLLTGCTAGGDTSKPQPPAETKQQPPVPPPIKPLHVVSDGNRVTVEGLKHWTVVPASDRSAFAFFTADGVWAMSPTGSDLRQLAKGDADRDIIEFTNERLLYLEQHGDQIQVMQSTPGKEPVQLAVVAVRNRNQYGPGRIPVWTHLQGSRLTLAVFKEPLHQVDLTTGTVRDIGTEPLTVITDILYVSKDGRYLIQKREHSKATVRIYDLETGTEKQPEGEYHVYPAPSPEGDRYAVLAAELDSGLPAGQEGQYVEGGTHIDVGLMDGTVRHLRPPQRLTFANWGPIWSPDGTRLAIETMEPKNTIWLIDVESNTWTPLVIPIPGGFSGWQDDRHVMLFDGPDKQFRLPVTGGTPEPVPLVNGQMTLANGTVVYRPNDITARDSVWVRRPGETTGTEVMGGDGTYDQLIPLGNAVVVVNHKEPDYRLIILNFAQ